MGRITAVFVAALLAFASGCVQNDPKDSTPPGSTEPGEGATPSPAPGSNASIQDPGVRQQLNETVVFDTCHGMFGTTDAAPQQVRDLVPPEFQLTGLSDQSVGLGVRGVECQKISFGAQTFTNARFFETYVLVKPANASWSGQGLDWYVLETYTDGLDFPGLEGDRTAQIEVQATDSLLRWSVTNESIRFEFETQRSQAGTQAFTSLAGYWHGEDSFLRIDSSTAYVYDEMHPTFSVLRSSGDSLTSRAFGATNPLLIGSMYDEDGEWRIMEENVFVGVAK